MRESSADLIRLNPGSGSDALRVEAFERDGDHIIEGVIRGDGDAFIPIMNGVPVFLQGDMRPDLTEFCKKHGLALPPGGANPHAEGQAETTVTFSDKWRRFKNYGLEDTHKEFLFGWYCKKLGVETVDDLKAFYRGKGTTLEVGPGSGFNSRFMAENVSGRHYAVDISEAAFTTFGNTRDLENCHVVQADLMHTPFDDNTFDFIIADGVLHHTPSTRAAVEALYKKVKPGGQFFFYVYNKMGPARYFSDQHIREQFMKLSPEACYEACEALTDLGRELSRLNAKITLTKPIDVLGIPAGEHDIQRLVYYNWFKCFWNDAFDYETNNMVNYDWYHPHHAWQHSREEVEGWLSALGVKTFKFTDSNPNGISVLLTKPE